MTDKTKIFKSKIKKLDSLKSIGEFIDLLTFYHLSKCVFKDCANCRFIDRFTQIYILFYPNGKKEEEDGSMLVEKLQEYFLSTLVIFIHFMFVFLSLYAYCTNKNSS